METRPRWIAKNRILTLSGGGRISLKPSSSEGETILRGKFGITRTFPGITRRKCVGGSFRMNLNSTKRQRQASNRKISCTAPINKNMYNRDVIRVRLVTPPPSIKNQKQCVTVAEIVSPCISKNTFVELREIVSVTHEDSQELSTHVYVTRRRLEAHEKSSTSRQKCVSFTGDISRMNVD